MAGQMPPQPDFEVITRLGTDLSHELGRCANLPAVQEGNLILQELRALREEIQELRPLREELRPLREEMRSMKALITTSNDNSISRLQNSQIITPDHPLMPLRSVLNNEPIPAFPETSNELQRLRDATVIDILQALGASTMGNAATRKRHLRLHCGLKQEPV